MPTHLSTCPFCEATCGIEVQVDGDQVLAVRGDKADPFSQGYICPKAPALKDLHHDPDRIRQPMVREGETWRPIEWDAAFALAGERLGGLQAAHGRDAVGMYFGNPNAHNYEALLGLLRLQKALGSRNSYSSASIDALPRTLVSAKLYGNQARLPVPDIDRTAFLLVLGANPMVSNGSVMTAPNMRQRLRDLRARGGRLVVIDPRRTETTREADAHHFIRPGADALLLAAMVLQVLNDGPTPRQKIDGLDALRQALTPFSAERVAPQVGMPTDTIIGLTRDFMQAPSAVCYGRLGTCTQAFGALTTWLIDLLNLLTGNLDAEGGAMFPKPAVDLAGLADTLRMPGHFGRWTSRVAGLPEFNGEIPVAAMADEIMTPGQGQLRGLIVYAGNPVRSVPGSAQLDAAFAQLDFLVAVDFYRNATTRHAHLILPPPSPLAREHFALLFHALSVRDTLKFSEPVLPRISGQPSDWQILNGLIRGILKNRGGLGRLGAPMVSLSGKLTPRQIIGMLMRIGPQPHSLKTVLAEPHGIDLGPLTPDRLRKRTIHLGQRFFLDDLTRLAEQVDAPVPSLQLVGRRSLRSMNSWLHNVPKLVAGRARCTLRMHPEDAATHGVAGADSVTLTGPKGAVEVPLEISDEMMPGVVSLPHGWGHPKNSGQRTAAGLGVNMNALLDPAAVDVLSGTSVLSGIAVTVGPIRPQA